MLRRVLFYSALVSVLAAAASVYAWQVKQHAARYAWQVEQHAANQSAQQQKALLLSLKLYANANSQAFPRTIYFCATAPTPTVQTGATSSQAELWNRLKEGGRVLLIRHAQTPTGSGDPVGFKLDDRSTQRNLSDEGKSFAVKIGEMVRSHSLKVDMILSSQWFRCRDTAALAFGKYNENTGANQLASDPAKQKDAAEQFLKFVASFKSSGVTVIVTHGANIAAVTSLPVKQGEAVVIHPLATGLIIEGVLSFIP